MTTSPSPPPQLDNDQALQLAASVRDQVAGPEGDLYQAERALARDQPDYALAHCAVAWTRVLALGLNLLTGSDVFDSYRTDSGDGSSCGVSSLPVDLDAPQTDISDAGDPG